MEQQKQSKLDSTLIYIAFVSLVVWILSPIFVMVRNFIHRDLNYFANFKPTLLTYDIWIGLVAIPGAIGLIAGVIYLIRRTRASAMGKKWLALAPVLAMVVFYLWCIINTLFFAEDKMLALKGVGIQVDCLYVYAAYGGLTLAALTVSQNKKLTMIVTYVFLAIATIMSVISFLDNQFAHDVFVNSQTNCYHYQGVFYNTNHYAYYLTIVIVVAAYLFEYREDSMERYFYAFVFLTNSCLLILNNTMGGYLAVLLTLIFAVIWSFINREDNKREPITVLIAYLFVSLLSLAFTDNLIKSFSSLFSDVSTVVEQDVDQMQYIGSSRGERWMKTIDMIKERPVTGHGLQSILEYSTHNIYLQIAAYLGVVGIALFLAIFVIGVIRLIKARKTITPVVRGCAFAVVAYMISAFFGNTVFYTAPYFYIVLGFCLSGALLGLLDEEKIEE